MNKIESSAAKIASFLRYRFKIKNNSFNVFDVGTIILGLGTYCALCFSSIGNASIWFDEAFSAYISRFSFQQIAVYTAADVHPPLYYWFLKIWRYLFGGSDVALRSLSVIFIAIAIVFIYLLIKRTFGRKSAFISIMILAVSPMLIRYGQEARMYAMVTAIAASSTYLLVILTNNKNSRLLWILYSILVAAGMLTHYFMAFIWVAHCIWYIMQSENVNLKSILSSKFLRSYILAILLFAPWLPYMFSQFSTIQSNGFWIGPVGADTMTNVFTNMFFYLDHDQVQGWLGLLFIILSFGSIYSVIKAFGFMEKQKRKYFNLMIIMSLVPVVMLYLFSLPPLRSSFVERYVLASYIFIEILICISLVIVFQKGNIRNRMISFVLFVALVLSMVIGINYVNYYGTYNKNTSTTSETKQLIAIIHNKSATGEPITVVSPWVYYEASVYNTKKFPVYFIQGDTQYQYGSLMMIKDNSYHKILNIQEFSKHYKKVWCIDRSGSSEIESPDSSWRLISSFRLDDRITGQPAYEANEYETSL